MNRDLHPLTFILLIINCLCISIFNTYGATNNLPVNCTGKALVCNNNVRVSINPGCHGFISIDGFLEDPCFGAGVSYDFEARLNSSQTVRETISANTNADLSNGISFQTDLVDCNKTYSLKVSRRSSSGTQTCIGTVTFQDQQEPVIYAPAIQTVALCNTVSDEVLLNSLQFSVVDFCHVDQTSVSVGNFPSYFCGGSAPTIPITIEAVDFCGNRAKKTIEVQVIRPTVFFFPGDSTLTCGTSTDPSRAGRPMLDSNGDGVGDIPIDGSTCGFQASFTDLQVNDLCGFGTKIIRTWKVIDVCNLNNSSTRTQFIEVKDTERPKLTCPSSNDLGSRTRPFQVVANQFDCQAIPNLLLSNATDNCSANLQPELIKVVSTNNSSLIAWPNDPLAIGSYYGEYQAIDACGNSSLSICKIYFDVVGGSTPNAICDDQINVAFNNGWTNIRAIDIDEGSYDNCGQVSLSIRKDGGDWADAITYNCDDVRSNAKVYLRAQNARGASTTCWVSIGGSYACETTSVNTTNDNSSEETATNNPSIDNGGASEEETDTYAVPVFDINNVARLKGAIYTIDNKPLQEVLIQAEGTIDYEQSVMTDENGIFEMDLPKNIGYQINPIKDTDRTNGISILDLIMITRHILGLDYLDSPFQHISADANLSGNITAFDVVLLRKLILDPTDPNLSNLKGWRFVEQGVELDLRNPLSLLIQENSLIDLFTDEKLDVAFTAIKVGDLNNTASTNGLQLSESRNAKESLVIKVKDQDVRKGDMVTVSLSIPELKQILGLQMGLALTGLELLNVQSGNAAPHHYKQLNSNRLNIVWDQFSQNQSANQFIELTLSATASGRLKDMIYIDQQSMPAIAYEEETILVPQLSFTDIVSVDNNFKLLPNQPNPFKNQTNIRFVLPAEQVVSLEVFDLAGKSVLNHTIQGKKGENTYVLRSGDIGSNEGIYVYQILSKKGILSDKLIIGK